MKLKEMITDVGTGQLSHTKLWANVGMAAMTFVFIKIGLDGGMSEMIMLVYGGIVAGSATASKIISLKMGQKPDKSEPHDK